MDPTIEDELEESDIQRGQDGTRQSAIERGIFKHIEYIYIDPIHTKEVHDRAFMDTF